MGFAQENCEVRGLAHFSADLVPFKRETLAENMCLTRMALS